MEASVVMMKVVTLMVALEVATALAFKTMVVTAATMRATTAHGRGGAGKTGLILTFHQELSLAAPPPSLLCTFCRQEEWQ